MEVLWNRLPEELRERVLSFLPVPALFRCRSVCKKWNALLRKQSFLNLCDLNGRTKPYLFVTHHLSVGGWSSLDGTHRDWTYFLDLNDSRWYSIPVDESLMAPAGGIVPRLLAMDDGLLCELSVTALEPRDYTLLVFDPVAMTTRALPTDGRLSGEGNVAPPVVVTAVDDHGCGFKVFLIDRELSILMDRELGFFVYESETNAWRGLENPPLEVGCGAGQTPGRRIEESAVFFQGNLYMTLWYHNRDERVVALRYNLEENLWRKVYAVEAQNPGIPQLVVSGNRMFLAAWVDAPCPGHELGSHECSILRYSVLEIIEIFVDESSSRSFQVRITRAELEEICGESQSDISFGFPLGSDLETLMLFSRSTGKVMTSNLCDGSIHTFPAHPLRLSRHAFLERRVEVVASHFCAKLMHLSLRNILSGASVPCSHA